MKNSTMNSSESQKSANSGAADQQNRQGPGPESESSGDFTNSCFTNNEQSNDNKMNGKFMLNKKYYTLSIYAVAVIAISALIIRFIFSIEQVSFIFRAVIKILLPFLVGGFIAYVLNPLNQMINKFLKKKCHYEHDKSRKIVSILLTYIIVFGLLLITIIYIVPQVFQSLFDTVNQLILKIPALYDQIYEFLDNFEENYPSINVDYVTNILQELEPNLLNTLKDLATVVTGTILPFLFTTSVSVIRLFLNALIALIVSIYALIDKERLLMNIRRILYAFVPKARSRYTIETLRECNRILSSFIIGKFIDSTIIGILCFITMSLLRMDFAVLISVIVGITNMIPYFGPFIGAVPGAILLLIFDPIKSLIFIVMIFVLQQFDGLILGPKILGDSTGLKPLWIIFAITIGGSLAGVAGMFFGVPVVAVLSYLFNRWLDKRLEKKGIKL